MHPSRVASAAWVFASAPNKVPFYVAGGLLACWAVVLAAVGITHSEFPGSAVRARFVMLTSGLLVAATITAAVATGGGRSEQGEANGGGRPSSMLQVAADPTGQPAYDKQRATATAGRLTIRFTNASSVPHNVTIAIGTRTVAATMTITRSATTLRVSLASGEYVLYCSVDAHRQAGMQARLSVR